MIGQIVTDPKTGEPLDSGGKSLTPSKYHPPAEVARLFGRVQTDFQTAYNLQRKPLDEFDGHTLLNRSQLDQRTFAAFVGLQYVNRTRRWRWRGRKNTARNKLISILAHLIAGMLYPYVFAQNDKDETDKVTARVMRILVEERLKNAKYELKFFYGVLSALVNPAVFISVEYIEELTTMRTRLRDGSMTVRQVIDEAVSGLFINVLPIDEVLIGDLYTGTGDIQAQPFVFRLRRISYDQARAKYMGRFFYQGKDLFDYVQAGQTRWMQTNSDTNATLFDIEYDLADANFVQELTVYYRKDDLQLTWVGGVGMFDHNNPYANPMEHRRMTRTKDGEYVSIPVYPFAVSGFEPIDPTGRFFYFKSGAFKEYWEDRKITELDRLLVDGVKLDVIKPAFISGMAKVDQSFMVPGASVPLPDNANVTTYALGPNLVAAHNAIREASQDMSESTQDKVMQGVTESGITATQTLEARQNARIFLGVFGFMIAHLVKQVGELTMDLIIQYDTVGELDGYTNGALRMKYRTTLARTKERGAEITNKIIFTDKYMGRKLSKKRKRDLEWGLYEQAGGEKTDQRIYEVNPYLFARTRYSMTIDADKITMKSMGTDRLEKDRAFEKLMDERALPYIDAEAVVNDFVIEEYAQGDPERYKRKGDTDELINAVLGQAAGAAPQQRTTVPQRSVLPS